MTGEAGTQLTEVSYAAIAQGQPVLSSPRSADQERLELRLLAERIEV
jgi:hypothetical protein